MTQPRARRSAGSPSNTGSRPGRKSGPAISSSPGPPAVVEREALYRMLADEQYRHLVRASMDAYWLVDMEGRLLDANEAAAAMYGYALEELLTLNISELEADEALRETRAHLARVRELGWDRFETRHRRKGGRIIDVEIGVSHMPALGGRNLVFLRDITARRREELVQGARIRLIRCAATHNLEELLVATLDVAEELTGSRVGFYHFLDPDQQTLRLQAWSTRTIAEYCRAVGKGSHYDIGHAGIWVDCVRLRRTTLVNDYSTAPNRRGLPAGHAELVRMLAVPVFREGAIVAILGVGNKPDPYDEDDSRLVERLADLAWDLAESKRASEAVRVSESRLTQAKNIAGLGIWEWNVVTDELLWSDEMLAIYGLTREEFTGLARDYEERVHPEDRRIGQDHRRMRVEQVLAARSSGKSGDSLPPAPFEMRVIRRDGSMRWVRGDAMPELNERGEPVRVSGVLWDITEQKVSEEERVLLERHVQQAQRLESLGVLAGGIAHDFNNLLTAILGHAELALGRVTEISPVRGDLVKIITGGRRAAELTEQMLAYSGRGAIVIGPVDLDQLIDETASLIRASISKRANLQIDLAGDSLALTGDARQLRQVLMNLVINASEALGERSGTIRVTSRAIELSEQGVRALRPGETLGAGPHVCLEVSDTGEGMESETLDRIFEPFFTTKFTGRGLGLSAVRGIVRSHRGAITVTSVRGVGTTFRLLFPRLPAPLPGAEPEPGPAPEADRATPDCRGDGLALPPG